MGSLPREPSKTHIIIATLSFYGHVRPLRSLAKELTCRGYPVTFITGSVNRKKIETIPGVDFVPFRGKADFHPDRLKDEYPDRPEDGMTALYDMEHIFFGHIHEQFQVLQEVIRDVEAQGRQAIVLQDAGFTGSAPMLLDSPLARRVPVISIGHMPLMVLSKDTAPFGAGMQSQGEEINKQMNAGVVQMFSGVHEVLKQRLIPYNCPIELPSAFPVDNFFLLPDIYCQLCPPSLEYYRSDLPPNIRYCGTLTGGNDKKPLPEWWEEFILNTTDTRPLIVVTSGSLPGLDINHLILPTIRVCANLPVRLAVCAVQIERPADLILPSNTRWAQWIAFEDIFPHTSLIVSSGGYGGISQAFAGGIPMVLAGTSEDKVETGLRAEMTGAAINLKTQTPSDEQIKGAVERILEDERYTLKAKEMQRACGEYDAVESVVGAIEELREKFYDEGTGAGRGKARDSGIPTPAEVEV
ncbi:hypothetical protein CKM354_000244300 [Cercospora kikuchii]|uniref:Erythromycin biosynthesis protein CIII-like C-terminal domain-containing protein n=1 Tax=Cercospora kikuchii TaxID=84275 RepID=A0A9P3CCG1_9PEZI|nr:uncharacterized protein CKM354_000244300 [Cercospora kikuchii]GIZ39051.1 hypothetical protein CKM354_000244300 [Cercospora kikuchii]